MSGPHASKLRRQIAWEAARLLYQHEADEYYPAKMKAARHVCRGWVKPWDLPSNGEIREQLASLSRSLAADKPQDQLLNMRLAGLQMMRRLDTFRPRLVGSVLTGHTRPGSDIDLHLFTNSLDAVLAILDEEMLRYDVQHKTIHKEGEAKHYVHIHLDDQFRFEMTVYPQNRAHVVGRCSISGGPMARASIAELEQLLAEEYPQLDIDDQLADIQATPDRFGVYLSLLLPLEDVKQNKVHHPEGDALYHSLQVFQLTYEQLPYDEELLTAALLHDVGKAIEPHDHVAAGLEALEGFISERTEWLIEHHMDAHRIAEGTIGSRHRRRLADNESYEELLLLAECDRRGRQPGMVVPVIEEAIDLLIELDAG
jgi:hypothetical protein